MKKVIVDLGLRRYPIFVGEKLENLGSYMKKENFTPRVLVVTNPVVKKLYFKRLEKGLKSAGFKVYCAEIPDGEKYKTLAAVSKLYAEALKAGLDRRSPVIALGGGVVGDITGFAAATFMRGVPLIQVPTTLLAMVDSSVGGKTGVDLKEGKNLVGSFYQPSAVWIDISVLDTLPPRQWRNGFAEVVKYGIISDRSFFEYLEELLVEKALITSSDYEDIILRCCQIKAEVVKRDEKEEKGVREILNLGHTFGHAIETMTGYSKYLHGEAVAIGMTMIGDLAEKIGGFKESQRIRNILILAGLPVALKESFTTKQFISVMSKDKKVLGGKFRYVIPVKIGKAVVQDDIPVSVLKEIIG